MKLTSRDKAAGWMHLVEWTVATIGLLGWAWLVSHPAKQYHECDCKQADIRRKAGV